MLRSLFSSVSGLDASQEMIDVIGNNIANINTDGFKSSDTIFESLLSQNITGATAPTASSGGIDPSQIGLGVSVIGTQMDMTQGALEQTGRNLDVAVSGDGFLVTKSSGDIPGLTSSAAPSPGGIVYTRAGSLNIDANGNLVDPNGNLVQGWQADNEGNINTTGPLTALALVTGTSIPATATGAVNGGAAAVTLAGNIGITVATINGIGSTPATSITVYDSLGNADTLSFAFAPQGFTPGTGGAVDVTATLTTAAGTTVPVTLSGGGVLDFGADGTLDPGTTMTATLGTGFPNSLGLNLSNVTATAASATSAAAIAATAQNGFAAGTLQSFSIATTGVIDGIYSNGLNQDVGQIALANFANPAGLSSVGSNDYVATSNSGVAQIGTAGTGGRGQITPGALEQSNVDLASQFTDLIEAQRGFEANGKVLTTSDQILQDLINLKQ